MQANSSSATGSSRRNQTSDGRSSRSSTSDPSSSRRRRDRATSTTSTTLQKSAGKPGPSWAATVLSNSEPPTQLFQELSLGAPRPPHSKRHLYQRQQESSNRKQGSATISTRAASLPDHLHDTRLQKRLEEEGLADIEEDDERARVQRRIVAVAAAGTSKNVGFTSLAVTTSTGPPERCSPGPSSEPQEDDIDELSSMSISGNNSFRTILTRELRALHDGTRSPKLIRSPPPPSRSLTSSPESVIFDNKEADIIQPNSFLRPKSRVAYPEGQGLSLSLEACEGRTEGSSANPLLDSVEAAKPPLLLPHAYSSEIPLYGQILPFGGPSDAPIVSPRPVHWISPPKPVPALHGPPSTPYARSPSAEGEDYGGNLHAHDFVWQERVLKGTSALHPDYVAAVDHKEEGYHAKEPDLVVLVDANLARGNQVKGRNKSGQPHNRLSRPLMDATNPQRPPRASSPHINPEVPRLGRPAWRTLPSRLQGEANSSPGYHPTDSGRITDRTVTPASPRPTVYAEPMQSPSPLIHALHQQDREGPVHKRSHPNHRSTRRDTRPAFIQQAIIDQEKERLRLEEQELQRRLDEEYRRLRQDHAEHFWENANAFTRTAGDFRFAGGSPAAQQHDAGPWTFGHWAHSATTPAIQNLHGPQMAAHTIHGYALGVGHPIAPPRPFSYLSNSPISRHPDLERQCGASPLGSDAVSIFSPSNFTHCRSHNDAPDRASPYNNAGCYLPYPPEPTEAPTFQVQSPIHVKPSGLRDGQLSVTNGVPLPKADRNTDRSYLTVKPIVEQELASDPPTLLGQDQSQVYVSNASHHKPAPLSRLKSQRANVLQPIAARLSNVSPGVDYLRNAAAPGPRTSPQPRRQTYAETLGKGLQVHPNLDGLPTPPGSSASDSASVSRQEKYEVLPPTPPALEPNALSLAWSEPLLEQLPSSWHTSDEGSAAHSVASGTTSTTNTRGVRHRRRNRRKGSNAVPAGGL
ncbi:hypothetical protein FS837_012124 [Tulasnella sp. UAMH 9824]|nr:hypothetical protein FS837_012124 [Tulasnella sp. UAMH 9824]